MSDTPGIVITGASGRMGQMLIGQVSASDRVHLAGAVERAGHAWVGQDIGVAMGGTAVGVIVTDNAAEAIYTLSLHDAFRSLMRVWFMLSAPPV